MSQFYKNNTVYLKVNSTFSIPTVLSFSKHQKKKWGEGKKKERNPNWKQWKERKNPKNIVSYSHQISTMYNLWKERYLEKNNYKYLFLESWQTTQDNIYNGADMCMCANLVDKYHEKSMKVLPCWTALKGNALFCI